MTPDQQIAFASVIASAAVAVTAVIATTWTAYLDRRARRHEARTSRQQDRLERTYLELATYVHHRRLEAEAIRPMMTFKDQPAAEPVTQAEIDRARSLAMTIASDKVRSILDEFSAALGEISNADAALSYLDRAPDRTDSDGDTAIEHHHRIDDAKRVLRDIDERRLHEQTRRELG
jgi:hypothetical protein